MIIFVVSVFNFDLKSECGSPVIKKFYLVDKNTPIKVFASQYFNCVCKKLQIIS